jgi:SAM-dependent methyltransferase
MTIELYVDEKTATRVVGWARESDYPNLNVVVEILADGKPLARIIADEYRADLHKAGIGNGKYAFSYVPSSPIAADSKTISAVVVGFHVPKHSPPRPRGPIPPAALRARVAGTEDEKWFDASGQMTADEWTRALKCFNVDITRFDVVADFGCGCGRALRHLEARLEPRQRLIGMDVDHEAIAWVAANYPGVSTIPLQNEPPIPLDDASVDLIVSHSVFTHLPEDLQFLWLHELWRILKPEGVLIASIHGAKVIDEFAPSLGSGSKAFLEEIAAHGFSYYQAKTSAEASLPEYYGLAFHTIDYINMRWTPKFKVRAWLPVFALSHQDVLVLQKK